MISAMQLLIAVLVIIGCYWLGTVGFKFDTSVEVRRKAAGVIAGVLQRYGLVRLSQIFLCYSCGDYSGFFDGLLALAKDFLQGEAAVVAELDEVFHRVFENKLADVKERAYLQSRLDATKIGAGTTPSNSPLSPAPNTVVTL